MLDGGGPGAVRHQALALGARLVFMGRPFLYGAAIAGAAGALRVHEILRSEIARDLALLGVSDIRGLDESALAPVAPAP